MMETGSWNPRQPVHVWQTSTNNVKTIHTRDRRSTRLRKVELRKWLVTYQSAEDLIKKRGTVWGFRQMATSPF